MIHPWKCTACGTDNLFSTVVDGQPGTLLEMTRPKFPTRKEYVVKCQNPKCTRPMTKLVVTE